MELGPARGRVRRPPPSLHRGAALGGLHDRRREGADPARGRDPVGREPADGLRLPHALSALPRGDLRRAGAAAGRGGARATDALPHPARGAAAPADRGPAAPREPRSRPNEDPRGGAARGRRHGSRSPTWSWRRRTRRGARAPLRERRLPLGLQRDRRHATTPCPAVLGHEGAGIVEAVGPGRHPRAPGHSTSRSPGRRPAAAARSACAT